MGVAKQAAKVVALKLGVWKPDEGPTGTISPRYCYSIWLRHMVLAHAHGLSTNPRVLAELGPGHSLGVGLAAMICGADDYFALDVCRDADIQRNIEVFDALVELFRKREPIPDNAEFPRVRPFLASYDFPSEILTENRLARALDAQRLANIRGAIADLGQSHGGVRISYYVPYYDEAVSVADSVDIILSQAVLMYVPDLADSYSTIHRWLKPGGYMSSQIDLTSLGSTRESYGHWTIPKFKWKLLTAIRPFNLNRLPISAHKAAVQAAGFEIAGVICEKTTDTIDRRKLAREFREMSDDDLTTASVFMQAVKR